MKKKRNISKPELAVCPIGPDSPFLDECLRIAERDKFPIPEGWRLWALMDEHGGIHGLLIAPVTPLIYSHWVPGKRTREAVKTARRYFTKSGCTQVACHKDAPLYKFMERFGYTPTGVEVFDVNLNKPL